MLQIPKVVRVWEDQVVVAARGGGSLSFPGKKRTVFYPLSEGKVSESARVWEKGGSNSRPGCRQKEIYCGAQITLQNES